MSFSFQLTQEEEELDARRVALIASFKEQIRQIDELIARMAMLKMAYREKLVEEGLIFPPSP